jgi:hypothetical protein
MIAWHGFEYLGKWKSTREMCARLELDISTAAIVGW